MLRSPLTVEQFLSSIIGLFKWALLLFSFKKDMGNNHQLLQLLQKKPSGFKPTSQICAELYSLHFSLQFRTKTIPLMFIISDSLLLLLIIINIIIIIEKSSPVFHHPMSFVMYILFRCHFIQECCIYKAHTVAKAFFYFLYTWSSHVFSYSLSYSSVHLVCTSVSFSGEGLEFYKQTNNLFSVPFYI